MIKRLGLILILLLGAAYCTCSAEALEIDQDPGDYTYFHSEHIINTKKAYKNTTFEAKTGNSYMAERLDYKNPQKGNRIILTRNNNGGDGDDVYFQTSLTKRIECLPSENTYPYRYFCLEGDFKTDIKGAKWLLNMLRDTTSGVNKESCLRMQSGTISLDGTVVAQNTADGKWHHIQVLYNFEKHRADAYYDYKCAGVDIPLNEDVTYPCLMRCNLNGGLGAVEVKNWEFTGLAKPYGRELKSGKYVPVVNHSSQFPDDSAIENYLGDKIVFHGEGSLYVKNGVKNRLSEKAEYTDTELFVSLEDINAVMETNISYDEALEKLNVNGSEYTGEEKPYVKDDIVYVPVNSIMGLLGSNSVFSYYGKMVIASNENDLPDCTYVESWFDEQYHAVNYGYPIHSFSDAEEISNYIFFDRPTAAELQADFNANTTGGAAHPRVLIDSSDVAAMRSRIKYDFQFAYMANKVIDGAEGYMTAPAPEYVFEDAMRTKLNAEEFVRQDTTLAFAYILTGDAKYSQKAIADCLAVCGFPDINATHIIDTGIWLKGLALCYDWCYDDMTEEQRHIISGYIIDKGIRTVKRAYYSMLPSGGDLGFNQASWFPRWKSNYIAFVQGGLVPACLAVAEDAPEDCFETLELTFRSWEYMLYGFYDDGVWLEGKTYENVVYSYFAYAMGSVVKCLGNDYNILEYPAFKRSFDAALNLTSLTASFSYGDDSVRGALANIGSGFSFYADYYGDKRLGVLRGISGTSWRKVRYLPTAYSQEMLDMIFYNDTDSDNSEVFCNTERASVSKGLELFSVHEDWNDRNALYFASAAGVSRHYHHHNDAGDFLLCMDGEMWTYEIGPGDYNVGSIYNRYSGRTEAHNTITINPDEGFSQREDAYAPIIDMSEKDGGAYAIYDMTELYSHHGAESFKRGFYVGESYDAVTVRDEMRFTNNVTGYWFMSTGAASEKIDDKTVKLTQNGKTLYVTFECAGGTGFELSIMDCKPLATSPQLANDRTAKTGKKKIALFFEGEGDITITARMSAVLAAPDTRAMSEWNDKLSAEHYEKTEKIIQPESLIWKEDFETDSSESKQIKAAVVSGANAATKSEIRSDGGNKYLYVYSQREKTDTSGTACSLFLDGKAGNGKPFTAEYDIKLLPYNKDTMLGYDGQTPKYPEYNMGLAEGRSGGKIYVTANPYISDSGECMNKNVSIFGERNISSYCNMPGGINWYDWNRFRWVLMTDENGKPYAEVYVNGSYYGTVGLRANSANVYGIYLSAQFNKGISEGGFCLDNIAFYSGDNSADSGSVKTINDVVKLFSKEFEDIDTEDTYTAGSILYHSYEMSGAFEETKVISGTVTAEKGGDNTVLCLAENSEIRFPTAFAMREGETTELGFKMSTDNGKMIKCGIENADSAFELSIGGGIAEFSGRRFAVNSTDGQYDVKMIFEPAGVNDAYISLLINGEEIACRTLLEDFGADAETCYKSLSFSGTGTLDSAAVKLYRGSRGIDAELSGVTTEVTDGGLEIKIPGKLLSGGSAQVFLAVRSIGEDILTKVETARMTPSGDMYTAVLPYMYDGAADTKLYVFENDRLKPITVVKTVYNIN